MLVVVLAVLGIASPLLALRWPAGLLLRTWRWPMLIWGTLILQVVAIEVAMPGALAAALHIGTYAAAVAFVWLNRAVPGVLVVGAGAFLNGITIALNGGVLPARAEALDAAGIDHGMEFANSAIVENPVLPWLGDVFAWPAPLPLANTFSVGDVLIVVGVWIAAWVGTRRLGQRAPAPAPGSATEETARAETAP